MATATACNPRSALLSAYLLGMSLGTHTELDQPPACFTSAEASEFRRGFGDARSRRVRSMGDQWEMPVAQPMGEPYDPTPEDDQAAAELFADPLALGVTEFDPTAAEVNAQAPDDYWSSVHEFETWERREDLCDEADINQALGRRVYAGEGVAA